MANAIQGGEKVRILGMTHTQYVFLSIITGLVSFAVWLVTLGSIPYVLLLWTIFAFYTSNKWTHSKEISSRAKIADFIIVVFAMIYFYGIVRFLFEFYA